MNVYANVWKEFVFTAMCDVGRCNHVNQSNMEFACSDSDSQTFPSLGCHQCLPSIVISLHCAKTRTIFFPLRRKEFGCGAFSNAIFSACIFLFFSRDRRLVFGSWSVQIHNTNTYEVYGGSYYRLFQYLHQKGVFLAASKANLMLYRMTANQHECKTLDSIQLGLLWFIHLHRDWVCEPNCCRVCVCSSVVCWQTF